MKADRCVVVVGCGDDVGVATAAALAAQGLPVALLARDVDDVARAGGALAGFGHSGFGAVADASDVLGLSMAIEKATDVLGAPEVLVYNAAYWRGKPDGRRPQTSSVQDFRVNIVGALAAARAVTPLMVARGRGTLLFVSVELIAGPGRQADASGVGAAGVRSMAKVLSAELAPKGVRCGVLTEDGRGCAAAGDPPRRIADALVAFHRDPLQVSSSGDIFWNWEDDTVR